jgi:hypothetical protein
MEDENQPIIVQLNIPIDQAWLIVDVLRVRGFHELAQEIINMIDEAANQLESD